MLWMIKGFARINGRGLFDAYCNGQVVVARKSYNECVQYVREHAADTDLYIEPFYTNKPRPWADVKAEWAKMKFRGEQGR